MNFGNIAIGALGGAAGGYFGQRGAESQDRKAEDQRERKQALLEQRDKKLAASQMRLEQFKQTGDAAKAEKAHGYSMEEKALEIGIKDSKALTKEVKSAKRFTSKEYKKYKDEVKEDNELNGTNKKPNDKQTWMASEWPDEYQLIYPNARTKKSAGSPFRKTAANIAKNTGGSPDKQMEMMSSHEPYNATKEQPPQFEVAPDNTTTVMGGPRTEGKEYTNQAEDVVRPLPLAGTAQAAQPPSQMPTMPRTTDVATQVEAAIKKDPDSIDVSSVFDFVKRGFMKLSSLSLKSLEALKAKIKGSDAYAEYRTLVDDAIAEAKGISSATSKNFSQAKKEASGIVLRAKEDSKRFKK